MDDAIKTAEGNNHLLTAIVGLKSQLDTAEKLLGRKGSDSPLPLDNPLLLATLGLLSSKKTFDRWLRDCEVAQTQSESSINTDLRISR